MVKNLYIDKLDYEYKLREFLEARTYENHFSNLQR